MIKKNILSLLLLLTALCTFNSCEEEPDDFYGFEQQLCGNTWSEWYKNNYGEKVYHEIQFDFNGQGTEYFAYYQGKINTSTEETLLTWRWNPNIPYSIIVYYPNQKRSYWDDINIVGNKLYAVWDDIEVILDSL